jgi:hypothetical protein
MQKSAVEPGAVNAVLIQYSVVCPATCLFSVNGSMPVVTSEKAVLNARLPSDLAKRT